MTSLPAARFTLWLSPPFSSRLSRNIQQINVILPVAGADYVGPLPAELQGYVDFAVGVLAVSKYREVAQALVKFMSSPEAAPLIRKSGMEPPAR